MNAVDFASGVSDIGSPARNVGSTIQPGIAVWSAALTLAGGGCAWATEPFNVSGTMGLIGASRQNCAMRRIDAFLRLIGRGNGMIRRVSTSISASSSDRRRHPRATSAAQSVLLPDPGGAGMTSA